MTSIGIRGGKHYAAVDGAGVITLTDGSAPLAWHVADEQKWHSPSMATGGLRQTTIDGTPVVESKLRVHGGDVIQRVYAVADHGGLVVVEFENDSHASVAVALTRGDVITQRPPSPQGTPGIDLPVGSIALPLGHHSTLRVALPLDSVAADVNLERLPSPMQVSRGWLQVVDAASRVACADAPISVIGTDLVSARCELLIEGIVDPSTDPLEALIGGLELVRLGENPYIWIDELVPLAERCFANANGELRFRLAHAAAGLQSMLARAGETRAVRDVAKAWQRAATKNDPSNGAGWADRTPGRTIPSIEQNLLTLTGDNVGVLMPTGFPDEWKGINFEAHGLMGPLGSRVGFAVRWHGENAAVLWESTSPDVRLVSGVDPTWSNAGTAAGDTLWHVS
jgi:hypothetical protein